LNYELYEEVSRMIGKKSKPEYVSPEESRRQKKQRDEAKKPPARTPDPSLTLAKAWGISKPTSSAV
jgi:hypothetical protein